MRHLYRELRHTLSPSQVVMLAVLAILGLLLLYSSVNLLIPYRPVTIYGYSAFPPVACPEDEVELRVESEVTDYVRRLQIEYAWSMSSNPGSFVPGGKVTVYDIEPHERRVARTIFVRTVPREPGRWRLVTDYEAYGSRLGMPVRQDFTVVDDGVLTVLPPTDERC